MCKKNRYSYWRLKRRLRRSENFWKQVNDLGGRGLRSQEWDQQSEPAIPSPLTSVQRESLPMWWGRWTFCVLWDPLPRKGLQCVSLRTDRRRGPHSSVVPLHGPGPMVAAAGTAEARSLSGCWDLRLPEDEKRILVSVLKGLGFCVGLEMLSQEGQGGMASSSDLSPVMV